MLLIKEENSRDYKIIICHNTLERGGVMKISFGRVLRFLITFGIVFSLPSFVMGFVAAKYYYQNDTNLSSILRYARSDGTVYAPISDADITSQILKKPLEFIGPSPKLDLPKGNLVHVSNKLEFRQAIDAAKPGDVILIAPGEYYFTDYYSIRFLNSGSTNNPIILKAMQLGDVIIKSEMIEGFKVSGSNWTFENLIMEGVCGNDSRCDHAFHVVENADNFNLKNNILKNFNSHLKLNAENGENPDYGRIENNLIYNERTRDTANSVTLIDAVNVNNWIVKGNIITDFSKGNGNQISYGAFFKGNGANNIFEGNLVMCEWLHRGGVRLGLSFGGGGSGDQFCNNYDCSTEHTNGVIRNNIVMNCSTDVGIYLNRSADTSIYNNLIYNTSGIDVRFPTSSAHIYNNIIDGRIKDRDGGVHKEENNITEFSSDKNNTIAHKTYQDPNKGDFSIISPDLIKDKGLNLDGITNDICGIIENDNGVIDIGPFSTSLATSCQEQFKFISQFLNE